VAHAALEADRPQALGPLGRRLAGRQLGVEVGRLLEVVGIVGGRTLGVDPHLQHARLSRAERAVDVGVGHRGAAIEVAGEPARR